MLFDGDPVTVIPDDKNSTLSMLVYTGDLGVDSGTPQSVYILDKTTPSRSTTRTASRSGSTSGRYTPGAARRTRLDDLERVKPWMRIQVSQTPGKEVALAGIVLALIGLFASLFIRPRRVWVQARRDGLGAQWSGSPGSTGPATAR